MLQRTEQKPPQSLSSIRYSDAKVVILFVAIVALMAATIVLLVPNARFTPEVIDQMPLWGP
jgi:hypothetical protein